ncbi:MAG: hypothetical protein M1825_005163 [Sarcosagium campestre]|nr:MAG: hypothetical protein M1825_005163 [Sarcosagium campestre]
MVGKRKTSTRTRSEAASKRQDSTPSEEASTPGPTSNILPSKLEEGQTLPTLDDAQSEDLALKDYKSVAESGVLAASLQQSRHKWLTEGVFERYWTKPTKRKGQPEPQNPPKDSMTKLGPCTVTIEPHVFETTLFTVKQAQPMGTPVVSGPSRQTQRPVVQYGPPVPVVPSLAPLASNKPPDGGDDAPPMIKSETQPQSQPATFGSQPSASERFPGGPSAPSSTPESMVASSSRPVLPPLSKDVTPNGRPAIQSTPQAPHGEAVSDARIKTAAPSSPQVGKPSPDPVIQMLATRATTDASLKRLMRVVASGKASRAELQVFQTYINEFTMRLQSHEKEKARVAGDSSGNVRHSSAACQDGAAISSAATLTRTGPQPDASSHLNRILKPGSSSASAIKSEPVPTSLTPPTHTAGPSRQKVASSASKQDISAVLLDFSAGSGDRFLFPKYSILDFLPGGTQVIVSFLIVRKGSSGDAKHYDPELDYYQPVNMRISAAHAKILEPLARVVENQTEVKRYMNDIMDNLTRAEYVHVAMRLPRDEDEGQDDEVEGEREAEEGEASPSARDFDTPPGSIRPPVKKLAKKMSFSTDRDRQRERESLEPWISPGPIVENKVARTRKGRVADPNKACHLCHTSSTSLWRKAEIDGESVTVCNACGIKWKTNANRAQEAAQGQGSAASKKARPSAAAAASAAPVTQTAGMTQPSPPPPLFHISTPQSFSVPDSPESAAPNSKQRDPEMQGAT